MVIFPDERTPLLAGAAAGNSTYGDSRRYHRSASFAHDLERNKNLVLFLQQFYAMFVKRALHTLRNKIVTFVQLAVPFFFTLISLIVIKTFPGPHDSPALNLSTKALGENVVAYTIPPNVSDNEQLVIMSNFFAKQFSRKSETQVRFVNNETGFSRHPNMLDYLLHQGNSSIGEYNLHDMVAADFSYSSEKHRKVNITAFFNNQAYHTPAIAMATVANALMQYLFNNSGLSIHVANHPLPRTTHDKIHDEMASETTGFTFAFNVVFGMSFLASSFALFLIRERATKAKHLQFTSGVRLYTFWSATFCWDMVNYLMTVICLLFLIWGFDIKAYVVSDHMLHITMLFVFYGFAMLPFMYLWSFVFTIPATGYVWLTMFNILSGIVLVFSCVLPE